MNLYSGVTQVRGPCFTIDNRVRRMDWKRSYRARPGVY